VRVLVCGGRDYQDYNRVISALDAVHAKRRITLIIEGGANGADSHAAIWADNNGIPRCVFPANWEFHGKRAGPIRNQVMIEVMKPDGVVAFPGGRGTADMIRRARDARITVWEVSP